MISVKREEIGKPVTARFNKSVSVEDLEKVGCLNFNALHRIAVERCKRHFDYDGSAYACEYTCVDGKEKTQHSYIPTEDRFVCISKRCSDRDLLQRLSIQDDLSLAYDFLRIEEENASDEEESSSSSDEILNRKPETKVTLPPIPTTDDDDEYEVDETNQQTIEVSLDDDLKAAIESDFKDLTGMKFSEPVYLHPFILERHINLIAAGEGVGKTTAVLAIVAELSRKGIKTIYLSCEDDEDEIGRALEIHEANSDNIRVACFKENKYNLSDKGIANILNAALHLKAKLIVIDPLLSFAAAGGIKVNDESSIRRALDPLRQKLKLHAMAVVVVHHWNKEGKIANSRQITATARMVVQVFPSRDVPRAMVMVITKTRHSDPNQESSLAYEITRDPENPNAYSDRT